MVDVCRNSRLSFGSFLRARRHQQPAQRVQFRLVRNARRSRLIESRDDEARNREPLTLAALIQSCDLLPKAGDVFQRESIARFGFLIAYSPKARGSLSADQPDNQGANQK